MRATTRTTLTLGDVLKIPIGIAAATGSDDVKFDVACGDGRPRQQQYVHPDRTRTLYELAEGDLTLSELSDADLGRIRHDDFTDVQVPEVVEDEDTIRGVRVGDTFRVVPPSEFDFAKAATDLGAIELLEVIDYRAVPTDRLAGAYWIQPDTGFARPLRTLMAAMRDDKTAMVVKFAVRSRQRLGVIRVRKTDGGKDALMLSGVVFASQWRDADAQVLEPAGIESVDERAVVAAREILAGYRGPGTTLATAVDDLPELHKAIVERAHDGLYDDPVRVLTYAAELIHGDGYVERGTRLIAWAAARWPDIAEEGKREEVERAIADGGEDVGEKLAAIVG
jgi:non-homologous end joining protein Ku